LDEDNIQAHEECNLDVLHCAIHRARQKLRGQHIPETLNPNQPTEKTTLQGDELYTEQFQAKEAREVAPKTETFADKGKGRNGCEEFRQSTTKRMGAFADEETTKTSVDSRCPIL
jgi:hypothetical protein